MLIKDIAINSRLTIDVRKDDRGAVFFAEPAFVNDEGLFIEPIKHGEAVLNFENQGLKISMVVSRDNEMPAKFRNIRISTVVVDDHTYHRIICASEGTKSNRRNAFRVFIGEPGTVNVDIGAKSVDVLVKDISITGISFLYGKQGDKPAFDKGSRVRVRYVDPSNFNPIEVEAKVVRCEDTEKGILYGCQFTRNYPQISRYVATKQVRNRNKRKKY